MRRQLKGQVLEYASKAREKAGEYAEKAAEQGKDVAGQAREKAGQYAEKAVEQGRERSASGLSRAAEAVRTRASDSGSVGNQAGKKLAEGMEATANRLRQPKESGLLGKPKRFALMVAGAVAGFLLLRKLRH